MRRFTYGALAEFDSPQATDVLFDVINKSDDEPDRTVTESAVIALTVRTDATLLPRLLASEKKLQDVVIRDDLDNARAVIEERAKYLASPEGKKSGGSIESAVRTYFIPALEPPPAPGNRGCRLPSRKVWEKRLPRPHGEPPRPLVSVDVRSVTFSPDKSRALARVVFEDPTAMAYYDFVLQKHYGDWTLASVWLGPEVEKPGSGHGRRQQAPDSESGAPSKHGRTPIAGSQSIRRPLAQSGSVTRTPSPVSRILCATSSLERPATLTTGSRRWFWPLPAPTPTAGRKRSAAGSPSIWGSLIWIWARICASGSSTFPATSAL